MFVPDPYRMLTKTAKSQQQQTEQNEKLGYLVFEHKGNIHLEIELVS